MGVSGGGSLAGWPPSLGSTSSNGACACPWQGSPGPGAGWQAPRGQRQGSGLVRSRSLGACFPLLGQQDTPAWANRQSAGAVGSAGGRSIPKGADTASAAGAPGSLGGLHKGLSLDKVPEEMALDLLLDLGLGSHKPHAGSYVQQNADPPPVVLQEPRRTCSAGQLAGLVTAVLQGQEAAAASDAGAAPPESAPAQLQAQRSPQAQAQVPVCRSTACSSAGLVLAELREGARVGAGASAGAQCSASGQDSSSSSKEARPGSDATAGDPTDSVFVVTTITGSGQAMCKAARVRAAARLGDLPKDLPATVPPAARGPPASLSASAAPALAEPGPGSNPGSEPNSAGRCAPGRSGAQGPGTSSAARHAPGTVHCLAAKMASMASSLLAPAPPEPIAGAAATLTRPGSGSILNALPAPCPTVPAPARPKPASASTVASDHGRLGAAHALHPQQPHPASTSCLQLGPLTLSPHSSAATTPASSIASPGNSLAASPLAAVQPPCPYTLPATLTTATDCQAHLARYHPDVT